MEKLLTASETKKMLRISDSTLVQLRDELGGFLVGKTWRYDESAIDNYIRQQKERARAYNQRKKGVPKGVPLLKSTARAELDLLSSYHL
jgi:hypothetical protein